jgi:hypothetical protein
LKARWQKRTDAAFARMFDGKSEEELRTLTQRENIALAISRELAAFVIEEHVALDESAVVFHANTTGKGELFVYQLSAGSTKRVSTNAKADYRYPHGEAAPC